MRIYVKRFLAILGSVMIALVAVLAAACTKNVPPEPTTLYTITAEYDETKGSVALSKTSAGEGEYVTVSVTAKEGFAVNEVTVNDAGVTLEEGQYSFAVTQDTVVKATFKEKLQNNDEIDEGLSVTVALSDYAKARGTVTLSAPADKVYRVGEEITLTVTPNEGYEVGSVTVNGDPVKLKEGTYSFALEGDVTVKATFHLAAADLPTVSGFSNAHPSFGAAFRGSWISISGETPIYISADKFCMGDNAISTITMSGSGGEQIYYFTAEGKTYSISWLHSAYSQGFVMDLFNRTDDIKEYFVKDPIPAVALNEHFIGAWIVEHGDTKLVIDNSNINYDGKDAEVIVDLGYFKVTNDGFSSPIRSNLYYFFVEGEEYLLKWDPYGENPIVNDRYFVLDAERLYHFSEKFQGTWVTLNREVTIIIGETSLTVNGTPYRVDGYNEDMFVLEWQGEKYEVKIFNESDFVLQLMIHTYNDNNIIIDSSYVYLVSTKLPTVAIPSVLFGEWKFSKGNNGNGGSISSADSITINGNDIRWGNDRAVIISELERSNGYSYVVAVRNMICNLSYINVSAGGDEEKPAEWVFTLTTSDGHKESRYEFVKNGQRQ